MVDGSLEETSTKRRASIFWTILFSVLIPEISVFITVGVLSYHHMQSVITEHEELQIQEIEQELIALIDLTNAHMGMLGEDLAEAIESATKRVTDSYAGNAQELGNMDLYRLRADLDVDTANSEIYILKDGIVINTTDEPDLGHNLYDYGADFKAHLLQILKDGKLSIDPLFMDENRKVMRYGYLPTHDRKYLIEFGFSSYDTYRIYNLVKKRLEAIIRDNKNVVSVNYVFQDKNALQYYYFDPLIKEDSLVLQAALSSGKDSSYAINDSLDAYYAYITDRLTQVPIYGKVPQVLRVVYDNRPGKEAAAAEWRRSGSVFGIALLVLFIIVLTNSRIIARPLSALATGAEAMEKGDLHTRVAISGTRETATLAQQFNAMAEGLERSQKQLIAEHKLVEEQAVELSDKNEELINLARQKEDLTSMIVHDLKNPLNTIVNTEAGSDPWARLKTVQQSGKRMLNMVMDILDVSRAEVSTMTLSLGSRNVASVVSSAMEQVEYLAEQKGIVLHSDVDGSVSVYADEEILERVIVNLLTNAIKFTPTRGEIKVEAGVHESGMVRIAIADNGPGIEPEMVPTIFARYGQGAVRSSGNVRSTGLGLTFCKLAVETHGGEIDVDSTIGKGSAFWFTIKQSDSDGAPVKAKSVQKKKEAEIQLSDDDRSYLAPFVAELKLIPIYKITVFQRIMDKIENPVDSGIRAWKQKLEQAVKTADKERYMELLEGI